MRWHGAAAACRRAQLECRFAFGWPDYLGTQLLAACGHGHADAVVALACGGLSFHGPWRLSEAEQVRAAMAHAGKSVALLIERDGDKIFVPVRLG